MGKLLQGRNPIIKDNLKDSDRISLIYNNQEVEMTIGDFKDSLDLITGTTTGTVSKTLTQAQVRTLNSANGGYGHEILPSPGAGKMILVTSTPIIKYVETGGSFANSDIWLYYYSLSAAIFKSTTAAALVTPVTYYDIMYDTNTAGSTPAITGDPLYLYASVEESSYQGTLTITFDYKIIDFN